MSGFWTNLQKIDFVDKAYWHVISHRVTDLICLDIYFLANHDFDSGRCTGFSYFVIRCVLFVKGRNGNFICISGAREGCSQPF